MSSVERRAGIALAAIFGLRMLGLFLILPVFAIHARGMTGGDNASLVGVALGAYGLTQMVLQIPFGMASDHYGRKPVIVLGLAFFVMGSVLAALASSLEWIVVGRAIQGAGAISGAVSALAADLTREQHRTKVMAMIGSTIGLMFAVSLVAAPAIYTLVGLSGIFWLTAFLGVLSIGLLLRAVPPASTSEPGLRVPLFEVLSNVDLLCLNFGIFTLHLAQMAMFVVLPQLLVDRAGIAVSEHWKLYLPAVLASFVLMVPAIVVGERRGLVKQVFVGAVALLLITEIVLATGFWTYVLMAGGLVSFFVAFNILEATLPSLISRVAPPHAKGTALGVYNTTQALGLFLGGALGGWILAWRGPASVFVAVTLLVLVWLLLALRMPVVVARASMKNSTRVGNPDEIAA